MGELFKPSVLVSRFHVPVVRLPRRGDRLAGRRVWHVAFVALLLVTALVFAVVGVVDAFTPAPPPVVVDEVGEVVDTGPVEAFGVQAAAAYLTLDGNPDRRDVFGVEVRLRQLEQVSVDPSALGHVAPAQTGVGLVPSLLTPVSVEVLPEGRFVVTVAARIQGVSGPRWVRVAVPVTESGSGLALSGVPAFVAGPPPFEVEEPDRPPADAALTPAITDLVGRFLAAYASSDGAAQEYMTFDNVQFGGLGGVVELVSVDSVYVPLLETPEEPRLTAVVVTWREPASGNELQQTYGIEVVNRDGRWQVSSVAGAPPGYAVS